MEKLLRILFVMCAIAFVTTATACADDKTTKTGGNDKTVKTPSIFKFTAEAKGVTIDESKDVYKITINPSLLTYPTLFNAPNTNIAGVVAPAPIFTVTFTDDKQGFIIPTTADKAEALTTTHVADLNAAELLDAASGVIDNNIDPGAPNGITHSFLADADADDPVFGFSATEINAEWSKLVPRDAVTDVNGAILVEKFDGSSPLFMPDLFMPDTKVRVMCTTKMAGINKDSFKKKAPAAANDLAIAKGTNTICLFSIVLYGSTKRTPGPRRKTGLKAWAKDAVELAKDDSTKNIQKMGFVGIVTGDDTASAITKAAGITEDADALGVKGFTAEASAKLVKAYKTSFPSLQKVEIVIAPVK